MFLSDFDFCRDRYMAQLQLMYTEKLAKTGQMQGLVVEDSGEEEDQDRQQREAVLAEQEKHFANKMLAKKKQDVRYGPSYERIILLDSERYNMGQEVDFLEDCRGKAGQTYQMTRTVNEEPLEETEQIKGGIQKIKINGIFSIQFISKNVALRNQTKEHILKIFGLIDIELYC